MGNSFFDNIPLTKYGTDTIRDISRRGIIRHSLFTNPYVFLPYTITDDERPEDVAFYYYEDPEFVWLIYWANNIIDPYSQWPLSSNVWDQMMIKKYQHVSGTTGYPVIAWTQNNTITENILHYINNEDKSIKINPYTYSLLSISDKTNWSPVRIFDYELQLNDDKRVIQLIDKRYANQAVVELKKVMNA